jgi:hypothetical protein
MGGQPESNRFIDSPYVKLFSSPHREIRQNIIASAECSDYVLTHAEPSDRFSRSNRSRFTAQRKFVKLYFTGEGGVISSRHSFRSALPNTDLNVRNSSRTV